MAVWHTAVTYRTQENQVRHTRLPTALLVKFESPLFRLRDVLALDPQLGVTVDAMNSLGSPTERG